MYLLKVFLKQQDLNPSCILYFHTYIKKFSGSKNMQTVQRSHLYKIKPFSVKGVQWCL